MKHLITEEHVEENVLDILKNLDYDIIRGSNEEYLPGGSSALRSDYKEVVLVDKLRYALRKINPSIPEEAREQAIKQILRSESQKLIADNESFHRLLVDGVSIPISKGGEERHIIIKLFDFENLENNEFSGVNQFTIIENNVERRPDVILFINGLPLVVLELKNLADEKADIWTAYDQFQTYKEQLPSLFRFNEILIISDGIEARAGTITSKKERFMQWKTINGEKPKKGLTEIEVLLKGMCDKKRILDIIRNFIVFEKDKETKKRFAREVTALLKAFSLAVPHDKAMKIKEEVGLFQAIKSAITKTTETKRELQDKFDSAIKQILSKAVISDRIIDIFEAAGIQKPELSILSEGFLAEVKEMPQKNLAFEALKKLLNDEIRIMSKKNMVQAKSFMDLLDKTIKKYTNRSIEAAQVIEELIELARKVRDEKGRGKKLNMNDDEVAFYDALGVNDSAVKILGDNTLRKITFELAEVMRKNDAVDWTQRESVQAGMRLKVKKILRRYGYPPDKEKNAIETVLKQAELIAKGWVSK